MRRILPRATDGLAGGTPLSSTPGTFPGVTAPSEQPTYPAHWEADVLLRDGHTAHLRPIRPDDKELLVSFYDRVSDESKYLRFFAPMPRLSERDVARFSTVDHHDRVAFVLTVADRMIAVGRYDIVSPGEAEVAFLVEDEHQGRGIAQLLLEHLAQAGRENGVDRFVADVLPENVKMIQVFRDAGYQVAGGYDEGVMRLVFPIDPTDTAIGVMQDREHRAEAASIAAFFDARSVAVIGGVPPPGHDRAGAGTTPRARRLRRPDLRRQPDRGLGRGHAGVPDRRGDPRPGRRRDRRGARGLGAPTSSWTARRRASTA